MGQLPSTESDTLHVLHLIWINRSLKNDQKGLLRPEHVRTVQKWAGHGWKHIIVWYDAATTSKRQVASSSRELPGVAFEDAHYFEDYASLPAGAPVYFKVDFLKLCIQHKVHTSPSRAKEHLDVVSDIDVPPRSITRTMTPFVQNRCTEMGFLFAEMEGSDHPSEIENGWCVTCPGECITNEKTRNMVGKTFKLMKRLAQNALTVIEDPHDLGGSVYICIVIGVTWFISQYDDKSRCVMLEDPATGEFVECVLLDEWASRPEKDASLGELGMHSNLREQLDRLRLLRNVTTEIAEVAEGTEKSQVRARRLFFRDARLEGYYDVGYAAVPVMFVPCFGVTQGEYE